MTVVFVDEAQVPSTLVDPSTITIVLNYAATGVHTLDVRSGVLDPASSTWEQGLFSVKTGEVASFPAYASMAGGETVQLYSVDTVEAGATVYFDTSDGCALQNPSLDSTYITDNNLEVVTPSAPGTGWTSIYVDNPSLPDLCKKSAFYYFDQFFENGERSSQYQTNSTLPPSTMEVGSTANVSINMTNTGTDSWTKAKNYKLSLLVFSNTPHDTWNVNRILLSATDNILQNQTKSFTWTFKAPPIPGSYTFQARMVKEDIHTVFGELGPSTSMTISVIMPSTAITCNPTTAQCDANCSAWIQTNCLNQGGNVYLVPRAGGYNIGPPGLKMSVSGTNFLSSNAPCNENSCARLKATSSLQDPVLSRNSGISNFYIKYLTIDGNKAARFCIPPNCAGCYVCDSDAHGGNRHGGANIVKTAGSGWHIINVFSINALCGSGASVAGTNFEISGSTFRDNGEPSGGCGDEPWADGITINSCTRNTCSSTICSVRSNTVQNSTDVGIPNGRATGCSVKSNNVKQTSIGAFSGIGVSDFSNDSTGSDYTGAVYNSNNIEVTGTGKMDFGLRIGPHAWFSSRYIHNGSYTLNTISGAGVNLVVDGACKTGNSSLEVRNNHMSGYSTSPFIRFPNCTHHSNYTRTHCYRITTTQNSCNGGACPLDNWYYHYPGATCGASTNCVEQNCPN